MSEEILHAIVRLFAILSRQGGEVQISKLRFVREYLEQFLSEKEANTYFEAYRTYLQGHRDPGKLSFSTSPVDSAEIIRICYKINATLNQRQKILCILHCFELIRNFPPFGSKEEILGICSDIFKIDRDEYKNIRIFVLDNDITSLSGKSFRQLGEEGGKNERKGKSHIAVLKVSSENLYLIRLLGSAKAELNGRAISSERVESLAPGSIIRIDGMRPIHFSSVVDMFKSNIARKEITISVCRLEATFDEGVKALHPISLRAEGGTMVAIMGSSGSGKSTFLKILAGLKKPGKGSVVLNGRNIHGYRATNSIGYVSQEDLLIEELTVRENLFYSAKLVSRGLETPELNQKVDSLLQDLGLEEQSHLKVGSVVEKYISGGQRKRLNIGLELFREPPMLLLDEPLSGLSSKDSENIMNLLDNLRQKGHLIFVVLHQPSSDIYKQFDQVLILDYGGHAAYFGSPANAIMYFKESANKINKELVHCSQCGNMNPAEIFDIIEEKIPDEYGKLTSVRRVAPEVWYERFQITGEFDYELMNEEESGHPQIRFHSTDRLSQLKTYLGREFAIKASNWSYFPIVFLQPLLLSILLSLLVRKNTHSWADAYSYSENDNIAAFIFMSIIVLIFLGLTISAEEIFRERKVMEREKNLCLSKLSYLLSKIIFLGAIAAIQTGIFVISGNQILEIRDSLAENWLMLFTVAFHAVLTGLILSSTCRSAVTIYIMIPLLIIPQLILGGAVFRFEDLNLSSANLGIAPAVSAPIPARWAYEAMLTGLFTGGKFESGLYEYDRRLSFYRYKNGAFLGKLYEITEELQKEGSSGQEGELRRQKQKMILDLVAAEAREQNIPESLLPHNMASDEAVVKTILGKLSDSYIRNYNSVREARDYFLHRLQSRIGNEKFGKLKKDHHNDRLEAILRKKGSTPEAMLDGDRIRRLYEPIFSFPEIGVFEADHLYFSPQRMVAGFPVSVYNYNLIVLWIYNGLLSLLLYFNVFTKAFQILKLKYLNKLKL